MSKVTLNVSIEPVTDTGSEIIEILLKDKHAAHIMTNPDDMDANDVLYLLQTLSLMDKLDIYGLMSLVITCDEIKKKFKKFQRILRSVTE